MPISGSSSSSTRSARVPGTVAPVVTATGQDTNNVCKMLTRMTGTWGHARYLLIFNVISILALFSCLVMWLSSGKIAFHASVFGLCLGMIQVSLCLGNLSAGLMEHVRLIIPCETLLLTTNMHQFAETKQYALAYLAHGVTHIQTLMFMTSITNCSSSADDAKNVHFVGEALSYGIIGTTVTPLLVLIPLLCCDILRNDTTGVLSNLRNEILGELCTAHLVACTLLALVTPSMAAESSKTTVFWASNMALLIDLLITIVTAQKRASAASPSQHETAQRASLWFHAMTTFILLGLSLLAFNMAHALNMLFLNSVENHHDAADTTFLGALIGLVRLPLVTHIASFHDILTSGVLHNRKRAKEMIVYLISSAHHHLVFYVLFASVSSLCFNHQYLFNDFVLGGLAHLTIMIATVVLNSDGSPGDTGVSLALLGVGFWTFAFSWALSKAGILDDLQAMIRNL